MTEQKPPELPKKKGCFFYGCLSVIIVMLLACGGLFYGYWKIKRIFTEYTDTQPLSLPALSLSDEQVQDAKNKVVDFFAKAQDAQEAARLSLSADEVAALLQTSDALKDFHGSFSLAFVNGKATGSISIPLEKYASEFKGRFLNGDAVFNFSMKNAVPVLTVESILLNARELPESFLAEIKQENLLEDALADPEVQELLKHVTDARIQGDRLVVEALPVHVKEP